MKSLLRIKGLNKGFTIHNLEEEIRAIEDVSMEVGPGEFVSINGRSGSGKSTVLKCIYRTYLPQSGEIWYHSERFGPIDLCKATEREIIYLRKYEIGYVSQFLNSLPRVTARELVEQGMVEMNYDYEEVRKRTEEILTYFELSPSLWDHYPNTFSGGEKLRLNMARAMVRQPRLLLLDEPTASLDQRSKEKVKELILRLKGQGNTMLGIFHDLDFVEGICDRSYTIEAGKIKEQL